MKLWWRMFTDEVMDTLFYYLYLPQLQRMWAQNLHHQRTLWLSSASLSTLKKHVVFFLNTGFVMGGIWWWWRGHDAGSLVLAQHRDIYQSSMMDDGTMCLTWSSAAQNDHYVTSKSYESDTNAIGSVCSFIALAVLWCHTVIILPCAASSWTHLSSIGTTFANVQGRAEPIQRMLKRKPFFI